MDNNYKRKGSFMKVKVPSFGSRVSKPSSIPLHPHSAKVKPTTTSSSVDYLAKQDVAPQPMKKVSFVVPIGADETRYDHTYFGVVADEYANMKASNYILSVKERFRLETLNSERRASQEISS